jgi:hypothetical protein
MMRLKTKSKIILIALLAGIAATVGVLLAGPFVIGPFVVGENRMSDIKWAVGVWAVIGFVAQFFIRCPHCGYRPLTDLLNPKYPELHEPQVVGERCRRCGKAY